ncbi:MAG: hypothetical protein L6Q99_19620 [Planctomycetes bacterium]|nr:hypothetical protein [Planctomycetota bacterium]
MLRERSTLLPWLLLGVPLCLAFFADLFACHAPRAGRPPAQSIPEREPAPEAVPELALQYEFRRSAEGVEVRASAEAPAGATVWSLPSSWAGNDTPDRDLGVVRAEDARGQVVEIEAKSPSEWVVTSPVAGRQTIVYRLAPTTHRQSSVNTDWYRPIVEPQLFQVLGGRTLLAPDTFARAAELDVSFVWSGFDEPGFAVASSFGAGEREQRARASVAELQHSVFVGGKLSLCSRDVRGKPVWIAIQGERWPTPAADFADVAARVVESQRGFFDDWEYPHYLISLVEAGPDDARMRSIGGTGLTNSFAMFVSPGTPLVTDAAGEKRVLHVLAHEMFHHWCGGVMTPEAPEELSYWFTEGFTDYFTRRLLLRAGLYTPADFEANLNEKLAGYYGSPVKLEPAERIRRDFWNDPAVSLLPYQRGDALAIELDRAIRAASDGARTINDWVRELARRSREVERPFTRDELFDSIARAATAEDATRIRAVAIEGRLLEPRAEWFAPCLALEASAKASFELGFDFDATREKKVITGLVPGSAAEAAGLREGDSLAGLSVALGDPDTAVEVSLKSDTGVRRLEYLPRSRSERVPSFRWVGGGDCGPTSGL